ncbi:Serine carboxypeptidase-like 20 [Camellia lanceoleosa]|uniref:Serine carboxypeptidase-like 20 n=1 Tax=Camellia lanceoleosa TaxID=1840588 RepID=A0ACC0H6I8_9ERIC|nr:Serine carboxypeptidase-like 20 [Camellia lanceoleosa]
MVMCETIFRSYYAGPFNFETGETKGSLPKLHYWMSNSRSKVSNIIYLDSPAGVGFSYSGNKSDYITLHEKSQFYILFSFESIIFIFLQLNLATH